jgi:hypothetical protein
MLIMPVYSIRYFLRPGAPEAGRSGPISLCAREWEDAKREAHIFWLDQSDSQDWLGYIIVDNDDPGIALFTYQRTD